MRMSVPASLYACARSPAERSFYLVPLRPNTHIPIAPKRMLQLPICPSRDVEGYRHTRGRNGKLLRVCVSPSPLTQGRMRVY